MNRPWIVVVGGFLGAGKTTLLLAAAKELKKRGLRSALVLNDQGEALVDTEYAALQGLPRGEVTGGCFCCRFSDLIREMDTLREFSPDVIFRGTRRQLYRYFCHYVCNRCANTAIVTD